MFELLRAVAFGWRQEVLAENAEKIRDLGEDLYRRLATFTEHLTRLGKGLGQSIDNYNKAVGSLERQVLPGARKFTELGIHSKKNVEELNPLEHAPRALDPGAPLPLLRPAAASCSPYAPSAFCGLFGHGAPWRCYR